MKLLRNYSWKLKNLNNRDVIPKKTNTKEVKPVYLNEQQKNYAIIKIDQIIDELIKFDPKIIQDKSDPHIAILGNKLDRLLVELFGHNTLEYKRHMDIKYLNSAVISWNSYDSELEDCQQTFAASINRAVVILNAIRRVFKTVGYCRKSRKTDDIFLVKRLFGLFLFSRAIPANFGCLYYCFNCLETS